MPERKRFFSIEVFPYLGIIHQKKSPRKGHQKNLKKRLSRNKSLKKGDFRGQKYWYQIKKTNIDWSRSQRKEKILRGVLVQQFAELLKNVWKDNLQNSQKSKTTICIQFVRRICKLSGMTVCKILFSIVIGDYMNFVRSFNLQNWQKSLQGLMAK